MASPPNTDPSKQTDHGRVVAMTGASGTLGSAFTRGLAGAGYSVYMLARNLAKAEAQAVAYRGEGLSVQAVECDALDRPSMERAAAQVVARAGRVDVLVNCAGGNLPGATVGPDASIFELDEDDLRGVTDLNFMGTVIPSLAFAKTMVERKAGTIVNVSSMSAQLPLTRVMGYSAAKAAVDNLTRWLAVELATKYGEGLRVNAIAPGFFLAEQNRRLLTEEDGSLTARGETIIGQTPARRFGRPEELVSTLLWLCDPGSAFVTGVVVPVDGGFSAFAGV